MVGFKDKKRQARLEKVAKAHGLPAVKLTRAVRRRMTTESKRPPEPEHVGVEDPQREVVLSYAWVVQQYNMGRSPAGMAEAANITQIELDAVLHAYSLQDNEDTRKRCAF